MSFLKRILGGAGDVPGVLPTSVPPIQPTQPNPPAPLPLLVAELGGADPSEMITCAGQIVGSKSNNVIIHPWVLDEWSFRAEADGSFVAPQGIFLVPTVLQAEAQTDRKKIVLGNIVGMNWTLNRIVVRDGDVTYMIYLGRMHFPYADFFQRTALCEALTPLYDEFNKAVKR